MVSIELENRTLIIYRRSNGDQELAILRSTAYPSQIDRILSICRFLNGTKNVRRCSPEEPAVHGFVLRLCGDPCRPSMDGRQICAKWKWQWIQGEWSKQCLKRDMFQIRGAMLLLDTAYHPAGARRTK